MDKQYKKCMLNTCAIQQSYMRGLKKVKAPGGRVNAQRKAPRTLHDQLVERSAAGETGRAGSGQRVNISSS